MADDDIKPDLLELTSCDKIFHLPHRPDHCLVQWCDAEERMNEKKRKKKEEKNQSMKPTNKIINQTAIVSVSFTLQWSKA